ncbi:MAG: hypothetical protein JXA93_15110 [Anaerolineae bacterium]|nr:hypothetical protein [Anaerolineae bacterium]
MEGLDPRLLELILYLLIGLVILTLIGLALYVVLANRRQRAKLTEAYEEERLAPRPTLQLTGQILSLVREQPGGPLLVEVAGHRYRRMTEIQDPQSRRQIVQAATELVHFTGALGRQESGKPAPLEKTYRWREDLREESRSELRRGSSGLDQPPAPVLPREDLEAQFLSSLSEMGAFSPPEKATLVSSIQHRLSPKGMDSETSRTFVDEIEVIVQRKIQLIPALARRDIHVRQTAGGMVRFVFEGHEYESLDDIPNMTVREVIKEAIREWDETT